MFHDNSDCSKGKAISAEYRRAGHRCRGRCPTCTKLDRRTTVQHDWRG